MAGLIEQNMADSAPAQPQPGMGQEQMPAEQMPMGAMEEEGEGPNPDTDPGYQAALEFAMKALYSDKAAKDIAKALRTSKDPVEALSTISYEIMSIIDERTQGAVPDELLALLATNILEEVASIAEAAKIPVKPSDLALALKQMILRFLGEQGVDTTQLQQAMDQVDPEEFNRMAAQEA
jgi:hypothetical protein